LSTQERTEIRNRSDRTDRIDTASVRNPGAPARPGIDRLPRPPGRRRPGLAALAVLLIVLGAATAGLLALRMDNRVPVLVARHEIPVGQQITRDDLAQARLSSEGISVIRASQADQVIGRYAGQKIASGRLIDADMLSSSGLLTAGRAAVGMSLEAGRYPAGGLQTGDVVAVVRAANGSGRVIADRAVVGSVKDPASSSFGGSSGGNTVITVLVDRDAVADVAAAAMDDQVSLVLLSRGAPAGGG
jgi:Flp pilus assembly protein CpaB